MENSAQQLYPPGHVIDGKYRIISVLGTGGMGTVFRVRQVLLNKDLALKMVDSSRVTDTVLIRRFQVEAKAAFSLRHPCLVNVHDLGVLNNVQPYLVMDLIEGITLAQHIASRGSLPLEEVGPIFAQACFALSYAHQHSVVHRDIKPGNIMLVNKMPLTEEGSVKILDFGIAKIAGSEDGEIQALTRTGDVFGSPLYMSPEQCTGGLVDHRSDVYSLGCVLFEALTGTPPHVGANALRTMMLHQSEEAPTLKEAALGREFSVNLERIVAKMLAKSAADRYDDLGVVAHELSMACSGRAEPIDLKEEKRQQARSKVVIRLTPIKLTAILVATAVVSIVATIFIQLALTRFQKPRPSVSANSRLKKEPMFPKTGELFDITARLSTSVNDKLERTKRAYRAAKKIVSQEVIHDGVKERKLTFPSETMGTAELWSTNMLSVLEGKSQDAQGPMYVPPNAELVLNISEGGDAQILANAFVFDQIGPKEIAGLSIDGGQGMNYSVLSGDRMIKLEELGLAHVLKSACKWSNLKMLRFTGLELTDDMFEVFDNSSLIRLDLDSVKMDVAKLARAPVMKRLSNLQLRLMNADEFLHGVSGSKALSYCGLLHCRFAIAALRGLNRCPNCTWLIFSTDNMTDQLLSEILQLKFVRNIHISDTTLTDHQISLIARSPDLERIYLPHEAQAIFGKLGISDRRVTFLPKVKNE